MKWWSVEMEIMYPSPRVSGTGSMSTLGMTDDEIERAGRPRPGIGFGICGPVTPGGENAQPRQWGECIWTARDLAR